MTTAHHQRQRNDHSRFTAVRDCGESNISEFCCAPSDGNRPSGSQAYVVPPARRAPKSASISAPVGDTPLGTSKLGGFQTPAASAGDGPADLRAAVLAEAARAAIAQASPNAALRAVIDMAVQTGPCPRGQHHRPRCRPDNNHGRRVG